MNGQGLKGITGALLIVVGAVGIVLGIIGFVQGLKARRDTQMAKENIMRASESLRKAEKDPSFDRNWIDQTKTELDTAPAVLALNEAEAIQRMIGALVVLGFGLVFVVVGRLLRRGIRDVFNKNIV